MSASGRFTAGADGLEGPGAVEEELEAHDRLLADRPDHRHRHLALGTAGPSAAAPPDTHEHLVARVDHILGLLVEVQGVHAVQNHLPDPLDTSIARRARPV